MWQGLGQSPFCHVAGHNCLPSPAPFPPHPLPEATRQLASLMTPVAALLPPQLSVQGLLQEEQSSDLSYLEEGPCVKVLVAAKSAVTIAMQNSLWVAKEKSAVSPALVFLPLPKPLLQCNAF